jgi:hypothetical protein
VARNQQPAQFVEAGDQQQRRDVVDELGQTDALLGRGRDRDQQRERLVIGSGSGQVYTGGDHLVTMSTLASDRQRIASLCPGCLDPRDS